MMANFWLQVLQTCVSNVFVLKLWGHEVIQTVSQTLWGFFPTSSGDANLEANPILCFPSAIWGCCISFIAGGPVPMMPVSSILWSGRPRPNPVNDVWFGSDWPLLWYIEYIKLSIRPSNLSSPSVVLYTTLFSLWEFSRFWFLFLLPSNFRSNHSFSLSVGCRWAQC